MLKKALLAVAVSAVSFGASADLSVVPNQSVKVYANEIFGGDVKLGTADQEVFLDLVGLANGSTAVDAASGKITFTLPSGLTFSDRIEAADLSVVDGTTTSGTSKQVANLNTAVDITNGGGLGSNTVTFHLTDFDLSPEASDNTANAKLKFTMPPVNVAKGSSSNTTLSVSSLPDEAQWQSLFTKVSGTPYEIFDSASAVAVDAIVPNPSTTAMQIDLDTRLTITSGLAGTISLAAATPPKGSDGATNFAPSFQDVATITVKGDFNSMSDVTYNGVSMDINDAKDAAVLTITGVTTYSEMSGSIVLIPDGKNELSLSDYSASVAIDYKSSSIIDDAISGPLESTSFAGLVQTFDEAMIVTKDGSADRTFIRITNNQGAESKLFAQLVTQDGEVRELTELAPVPANTTVVLNSADIEEQLGEWTEGRSRISFQSDSATSLTIVTISKGEANVMSQISN